MSPSILKTCPLFLLSYISPLLFPGIRLYPVLSSCSPIICILGLLTSAQVTWMVLGQGSHKEWTRGCRMQLCLSSSQGCKYGWSDRWLGQPEVQEGHTLSFCVLKKISQFPRNSCSTDLYASLLIILSLGTALWKGLNAQATWMLCPRHFWFPSNSWVLAKWHEHASWSMQTLSRCQPSSPREVK